MRCWVAGLEAYTNLIIPPASCFPAYDKGRGPSCKLLPTTDCLMPFLPLCTSPQTLSKANPSSLQLLLFTVSRNTTNTGIPESCAENHELNYNTAKFTYTNICFNIHCQYVTWIHHPPHYLNSTAYEWMWTCMWQAEVSTGYVHLSLSTLLSKTRSCG